jgi:hypothetical protein
LGLGSSLFLKEKPPDEILLFCYFLPSDSGFFLSFFSGNKLGNYLMSGEEPNGDRKQYRVEKLMWR